MRLLLIDRDGVINHDSEDFIKTPHEWRPIAGALGAISRASQLGFHIVVVSNQSGLARGLVTPENLHRIHNRMLREVETHGGKINAIFFCPHLPEEQCSCRKPNTALFESIGERLGVPLEKAIFIGDRKGDILASQRVGALPILVKTGHGKKTLSEMNPPTGFEVCEDLSGAVDWIRTNFDSLG